MADKKDLAEEFIKFYELMNRLRAECPWDKEQTHKSLRRCLLEETHEVLDAIDSGDMTELKKELGDVMLQVLFHSVMAEETNDFTLVDVMKTEQKKLIDRHPHIFGDVKVANSDEVKVNWEKLKAKEGRKSVLDGIPSELPALFRAYRIQEKASKVGFDWKEEAPVLDKISEELEELKENVQANKSKEEIEDELGDLLFSIVNYARFLKINPEDALRGTIKKFTGRFQKIEEFAKSNNKQLEEMTLEEMDAIWEQSK